MCKNIEEAEKDSSVDHLDEMNNKRKTMEEDSRTQGFKRGLEADKILGSADDNGELMYLIQWWVIRALVTRNAFNSTEKENAS